MMSLPSTAKALLNLIARAKTPPVCLVDFHREGGATYYSLRRMEEFIAQGKGVVRLTCEGDGTLVGTVYFRDIQSAFRLPGIHALAGEDLPRFGLLLINELVGWTLPEAIHRAHTAVGEGKIRWIPALIRILLQLAEGWNARLEYVVHDYFPVCPNFSLLCDETQETYCGVPGLDQCAQCLAQPFLQAAFGPAFPLAEWRNVWNALFERANRIVCPSLSARDILSRAFPPEGKRLALIPHAPLGPAPKPLQLSDNDSPMHIAVVGQINIPKGAKILYDLALLLQKRQPQARLTLVGDLVAPGLVLPDFVTVTGRYQKERLAVILRELGVTVGLIPSLCPETFNYVCQELMLLGLPLVCFDIGAPPERVRERGLVAQEATAESALEALCILDAQRSKLL